MLCKKTNKETTQDICNHCQRKCDLAINSRYNKPGNYPSRDYTKDCVSNLPLVREIARINIEREYPTTNYANSMPIMRPKKKVFLGLSDILKGTEPITI